VDEERFRYPGRKPQSKETALVMLADGCEAAVRSARPESAEELARIVNRIIDQRVEDRQLDESGLTLQDIETIREVFVSALKGTFHPRIKYPEPKTEERMAETEASQVVGV
jgi:membrane-associated HD superfamily phosphohydrolase